MIRVGLLNLGMMFLGPCERHINRHILTEISESADISRAPLKLAKKPRIGRNNITCPKRWGIDMLLAHTYTPLPNRRLNISLYTAHAFTP